MMTADSFEEICHWIEEHCAAIKLPRNESEFSKLFEQLSTEDLGDICEYPEVAYRVAVMLKIIERLRENGVNIVKKSNEVEKG